MRKASRSKIHRARVTGANPDDIGSVLIDATLIDMVDMWQYEKVLLCNATNGQRWETYAVPGKWGSGEVSVQGAGAWLCQEGDCLIILMFEASEEAIEPQMILVDQENRFVQYIEGANYEH